MTPGPPISTPSLPLSELARLVGGTVRGDGAVTISGVATLEEAGAGDITWAVRSEMAPRIAASRAGAVLGPTGLGTTRIPALLVADVEAAIATILARFATPHWGPAPGVHPTAQIDPSAVLEAGVAVGPHVVVGPHSRIGERVRLYAGVYVGARTTVGTDCEFWPNVFVGDGCQIGNRVRLWPNAVIGRDGFGFIFRSGVHQRVPQIGGVILEDDVEVGAGSCVDRAKVGATRVGRGTKIDNLVQFAHNSSAGPGCILVAQVGLSGSVRLGTGVVLGGQAGVADNLSVGDGVRVSAQTGVTHSLPPKFVAAGPYARDRMQVLREQAALQRLPALLKEFDHLAERVRELEAAADDRRTG
ncbi:MAG: UDP-3-O-(3-hydroxymyristoyl)glucosamine N-acyltransferase [Phycisphaerae bacterium]